MASIIVAALALALFQLWLLPASFALSDLGYLLSSRDNPPPQSQLQARTARAGTNLQESLPAFLALTGYGARVSRGAGWTGLAQGLSRRRR